MEMREFLDEFLMEIDKVERFYTEKCQYYAKEFKTLREAFKKFDFKDVKYKKKGAKLKRINNLKETNEIDESSLHH